MKDPAFLFYSGDFIAGVSEMTMEERGQYITLLCFQHGKGHLTMDFINRVVPNLSQYVLSKFVKDDKGLFYNERLELEAEKRKKYSESRSNNRKGKTKDTNITSKTYDIHMENENRNINDISNSSNISSSSNTIIGEKIEKKSKRTKPKMTDDEFGRMKIANGFQCYGEFENVFLTDKEMNRAKEKVGTMLLKEAINQLSAWKEDSGQPLCEHVSDIAKMHKWVFDKARQVLDRQGLDYKGAHARELGFNKPKEINGTT